MTPTLITWIAVTLFTGLALFLFPKIGARLLTGIREFRKASDQVVREFRGDDDDDNSHAA